LYKEKVGFVGGNAVVPIRSYEDSITEMSPAEESLSKRRLSLSDINWKTVGKTILVAFVVLGIAASVVSAVLFATPLAIGLGSAGALVSLGIGVSFGFYSHQIRNILLNIRECFSSPVAVVSKETMKNESRTGDGKWRVVQSDFGFVVRTNRRKADAATAASSATTLNERVPSGQVFDATGGASATGVLSNNPVDTSTSDVAGSGPAVVVARDENYLNESSISGLRHSINNLWECFDRILEDKDMTVEQKEIVTNEIVRQISLLRVKLSQKVSLTDAEDIEAVFREEEELDKILGKVPFNGQEDEGKLSEEFDVFSKGKIGTELMSVELRDVAADERAVGFAEELSCRVEIKKHVNRRRMLLEDLMHQAEREQDLENMRRIKADIMSLLFVNDLSGMHIRGELLVQQEFEKDLMSAGIVKENIIRQLDAKIACLAEQEVLSKGKEPV
jgi:hypothetical protein